jgi:hypothetical protein
MGLAVGTVISVWFTCLIMAELYPLIPALSTVFKAVTDLCAPRVINGTTITIYPCFDHGLITQLGGGFYVWLNSSYWLSIIVSIGFTLINAVLMLYSYKGTVS